MKYKIEDFTAFEFRCTGFKVTYFSFAAANKLFDQRRDKREIVGIRPDGSRAVLRAENGI